MKIINFSRSVLKEVLEFFLSRDPLIVESIDRLSRNYDEVIDTMNFLKQKDVQLAKRKGIYKGRLTLYSPNAKEPQKRLVYHRVVSHK